MAAKVRPGSLRSVLTFDAGQAAWMCKQQKTTGKFLTSIERYEDELLRLRIGTVCFSLVVLAWDQSIFSAICFACADNVWARTGLIDGTV